MATVFTSHRLQLQNRHTLLTTKPPAIQTIFTGTTHVEPYRTYLQSVMEDKYANMGNAYLMFKLIHNLKTIIWRILELPVMEILSAGMTHLE